MNTTNYHHCEKCDKYYHSDYWWLYHQESKHSGTDEIEADYEISLEKDNREPYL